MRFDGIEADEVAVTSLLENIPALLSEDERGQVQEYARRIAEINGAMFEIAVAAADRHATSPQDVFNAREAIMRHFAMMSLDQTMLTMNEVVTIN